MKLTILSSSPRPNSLSNRLALFLKNEVSQNYKNIELEYIDVREWLPKMDYGQEVYQKTESTPESLKPLARIMFSTDAFLLVSPEYNGSYPYSLKKLLDHFPKQKGKVFGIATTSPGALGGMRCALALQHYVVALLGTLSPQMLITPTVEKKFNDKNDLIDPTFQQSIDVFLESLVNLMNQMILQNNK